MSVAHYNVAETHAHMEEMRKYAEQLFRSRSKNVRHLAGVAKVNINQADGQLKAMPSVNTRIIQGRGASPALDALQETAYQLFANTEQRHARRLDAVIRYGRLLKQQIEETRLAIGVPLLG